jgi:hypothetical protein
MFDIDLSIFTPASKAVALPDSIFLSSHQAAFVMLMLTSPLLPVDFGVP